MIRRARQKDVQFIHRILAKYGQEGQLLGRPLTEIYDFLRDFLIAEDSRENAVGVCGLHLCWENLAEIRSLAVEADQQGQGWGTKLVEACCSESLTLGFHNVFALTYRPGFFASLGFVEVDKQTLPNKIWADCIKCVKFPDCDETAMFLEM